MVYDYWRNWRLDGTWERIHTVVRERVRQKVGRHPQPSAGLVDSQSVKTGVKGYDSGKHIKGRKRHVLVDTQGLLLKVKVQSTGIMDRDGIKLLLAGAKQAIPRLRHVWLDGGYNGKKKGKDWVEKVLGWTATIVRHPRKVTRVIIAADVEPDWEKILAPQGFRVLPRLWVVERIFAWAEPNRRLSKDYERLCETSETVLYAAMIRLMLRRLARP